MVCENTALKYVPEDISLDTELNMKRPLPTQQDDSPSSIRMYMLEMGKIAVLKPEEEIALATRVKAGDKEAKKQMVNANLRLVISIAKHYSGRGMPLEDLIQEGNIGLMKAVDEFDVDLGFKFSTYATWWIKQSIFRSLCNTGRTVRLPVHTHEKIFAIKKKYRELSATLGTEPTEKEVADALGMTESDVSYLIGLDKDSVSLDTPIGDGDDSSLGDFVEDGKNLSVEDAYEKTELKDLVGGILGVLNDRERQVIQLRFGLSGLPPMTLEEVGQEMGVTRERIRQIEAKALRKMKKSGKAYKLRGYVSDETFRHRFSDSPWRRY